MSAEATSTAVFECDMCNRQDSVEEAVGFGEGGMLDLDQAARTLGYSKLQARIHHGMNVVAGETSDFEGVVCSDCTTGLVDGWKQMLVRSSYTETALDAGAVMSAGKSDTFARGQVWEDTQSLRQGEALEHNAAIVNEGRIHNDKGEVVGYRDEQGVEVIGADDIAAVPEPVDVSGVTFIETEED